MIIQTQNQRFLIAFAAIAILVIGTFIGSYIAVRSGGKDIDAIIVSLNLTAIGILLIIVSFILEIREALQPNKNRMRR